MPDPSASASPRRNRLSAIDWMRGVVMLLMTIDHSSDAFNAGRSFTDAAFAWKPGTHLDPAQYLTRWITHLCAPTFVFLAGASLALMADRRTRAGETPWQIDRQLLVRGFFIAALDPLWMSLGFAAYHRLIFQVLYAIGTSMMIMALLRRLPSSLLAILGVTLIVGVDLVWGARLESLRGTGRPDMPLPLALLFTGGFIGRLIIVYPVASWLGMMLLGWAFGRRLVERRGENPAPMLALAGLASLALFALLRGLDGFGNMALHREGNDLLQWLHVSKYPPSITYVTLELGIMALMLAVFFHLSVTEKVTLPLTVLGVYGGSAMLYYLLHLHLMVGASHLLGVHGKLGLGATYLGALLCALVLYYPCRRYGQYKAGHSNWFTRLV